MRGRQTETTMEACVLCGSRAARRLFTARDRLYRLPGEFWVVRCADCGLARTSPQPSGEALAAYYPGDYAPHGEASAEPDSPPRRGLCGWVRRNVVTRRIWWLPDLPRGARVLELGSGSGRFVHHALGRGWEVHALEPAAVPAERLARDPRVRVHRHPAEEMDFPPETFDAVFAWMVVEHLPDPAAVLRRVAAALRPRGYLVLSVPNAGSWEFAIFGTYWYGLDVPRHLWHFTPRTLRRLLEGCGLTMERVLHQKVLKNISGSLGFLVAERPRLARVGRLLGRALGEPWISFALGAAFAALRQGGRLTVVARRGAGA